jgi:N-acetylmuramoyl-L-alanine amidase
MRWSSAPAVLSLITALLLAPLTSISADEHRIFVYSTLATYTLPVVDRQGREYVGLLEILEPLGKVNSRSDGSRWKIRYNNVDGEFTVGKTRGRVGGRDLDLASPFLLENGRGMVPVTSLGTLLPRFLGGPVNFHDKARRLFIGNVATQFTVDLVKTTPPRLLFNFSNPVNPAISTEPGHLRMAFTRDPVIATSTQEWKFEDHTISSVVYSENNGAAEITVSSPVSLMASFSAGGRTITVTAPPPAPATGASPRAPAPGPVATTQPSTTPSAPAGLPASQRRFLVVVDASHGGSERGAALTDQLAEKDVTLAFARQLRRELESRAISVLMVRDSDALVALDQRAATGNAARPAIYINVHATSQGIGVRLYSAMLPAGMDNRGHFLDWDTAQAGALAVSQQIAAGAAAEFQKRRIPARSVSAPLRPLNNLATPAVTIELAPPGGNVSDVNSPPYQQPIAATLAEFLSSQRARLEGPR